jgi:hypothetical protein
VPYCAEFSSAQMNVQQIAETWRYVSTIHVSFLYLFVCVIVENSCAGMIGTLFPNLTEPATYTCGKPHFNQLLHPKLDYFPFQSTCPQEPLAVLLALLICYNFKNLSDSPLMCLNPFRHEM